MRRALNAPPGGRSAVAAVVAVSAPSGQRRAWQMPIQSFNRRRDNWADSRDRASHKIIYGAMSAGTTRREDAAAERYDKQGVSYGEGYFRDKARVRGQLRELPQWRRMQMPSSPFFQQKHYEQALASHVPGSDVAPLLDVPHFPHPAQVFLDLSDRGNHGAGVALSDKALSHLLTRIARRAKKAGNGAEEAERAAQVHAYCLEHARPRHVFGKRAKTSLLRCYVAAGLLRKAETLYREMEAGGQGVSATEPQLGASVATLLCRQGKGEEAWRLYKAHSPANGDGGRDDVYRDYVGSALLSELCRAGTAEGSRLAEEVLRELQAEDAAFPSSAVCVGHYVRHAWERREEGEGEDERVVEQMRAFVAERQSHAESVDELWVRLQRELNASAGGARLLAALLEVAPPDVARQRVVYTTALGVCAEAGDAAGALALSTALVRAATEE
eukprot:Rhum_TRINITY_DN12483_c0_g1::Rhum_TRINITY_DN12483_c0_g1_i1::g.52174::m.52174